MGVETKGWVGGDGSMADAIFEHLGSGRAPFAAGRVQITDGPLATMTGYDPLSGQRAWNERVDIEMAEKTARVLGSDNAYESGTSTPGGNRMVQEDTSAGRQAAITQTPDEARGHAGEPSKVESAPDKGSRGSTILKRIRARKGAAAVTTSTKDVGVDKVTPPVATAMLPEDRKGNLADGADRSAWTGSGPVAALHDDYSKVGELLAYAGVPAAKLAADSLLLTLATGLMTKEASEGSEYLKRDDVHPLKLMAELTDVLGDDWMRWEPETIRETLIKKADVTPGDDVMSKIMAVKIVLQRPDVFYGDWQAMEKIAVALNDASPAMGSIEDVPAEWLSNAVAIVEKIAGAGDFAADVTKYVALRLFDQGYVVTPPLLKFADAELGKRIDDEDLRRKVILAYARAVHEPQISEAEDPVSIQVARLVRNNAYVLDRLDSGRQQLGA